MAEIKENVDKKKNIHQGHRKNVRESYYQTGLNGMPPHKILEFILFFGIPQRDTNALAHELIDRFGSFSKVLEAKRTDLLKVKGMTETAACLISLYLPIYKKYYEDVNKKKLILNNRKDYISYLKTLYLDNPNFEKIYILCLDAQNRLIVCREISQGDASKTFFDLRKIASIALEVDAKKIVLSHNHPGGTMEPSKEDCVATDKLRQLLELLNVKLLDHVIITRTGHFAMAESGYHIHYLIGCKPVL